MAIALGRAFTVYPVAFILNLFRSNPIPYDYQHIMWFTGIRGAIAFSISINNTSSDVRQVLFTTTCVIIIVTGNRKYARAHLRAHVRICAFESAFAH